MKELAQNLINVVDATFSKDDLQSAPRKVLEELIIHLYDGLHHIIEESDNQ